MCVCDEMEICQNKGHHTPPPHRTAPHPKPNSQARDCESLIFAPDCSWKPEIVLPALPMIDPATRVSTKNLSAHKSSAPELELLLLLVLELSLLLVLVVLALLALPLRSREVEFCCAWCCCL